MKNNGSDNGGDGDDNIIPIGCEEEKSVVGQDAPVFFGDDPLPPADNPGGQDDPKAERFDGAAERRGDTIIMDNQPEQETLTENNTYSTAKKIGIGLAVLGTVGVIGTGLGFAGLYGYSLCDSEEILPSADAGSELILAGTTPDTVRYDASQRDASIDTRLETGVKDASATPDIPYIDAMVDTGVDTVTDTGKIPIPPLITDLDRYAVMKSILGSNRDSETKAEALENIMQRYLCSEANGQIKFRVDGDIINVKDDTLVDQCESGLRQLFKSMTYEVRVSADTDKDAYNIVEDAFVNLMAVKRPCDGAIGNDPRQFPKRDGIKLPNGNEMRGQEEHYTVFKSTCYGGK